MSESKVTASHLRRTAAIYVRQSSLAQVERNRESTARQYDLVSRAETLGWPRGAVSVIDEDLGVSGASTAGRSGFAELVTRVGLGQVGIVLALECSRLARNNADWYRLLDLAGMTDTLIADADGVYHPGLFNDRMLLGMKGTMSEAELHILRARLDGGIRNKAARGELRCGLPVGLVWGEADGQILTHPDEAVRGVIAAIFEQFPRARIGAGGVVVAARPGPETAAEQARIRVGVHRDRVGRPDLSRGPHHPHPSRLRGRLHLRPDRPTPIRRRRRDTADPAQGAAPQPSGRSASPTTTRDSSTGTPTWPTRPASAPTSAPSAHQPGTGALREGCALLQGLATCGTCGRKLAVFYDGERKATPGYYCTGTGQLVDGRGTRHLRVGGVAIDAAVTAVFLTALAPAAAQACLAAAQQLEDGHDAALAPMAPPGGNRPLRGRPKPNAATRPSIRRTGSSPAAWNKPGKPRCDTSPTPKPNSPAARPHDRKH